MIKKSGLKICTVIVLLLTAILALSACGKSDPAPGGESGNTSQEHTGQQEQIETYTVTWKNHDGTTLKTDSVEYGSTPTYTGSTPTKPADAQYSYAFRGWDKMPGAVTEDVTYVAQYEQTVRKYTVTWKNYDGTTLKTDSVEYGSTPTYTGSMPTKPADAQYPYAFKGWDKALSAVTGNVTYTAQFTNTTNKYTVTWKNYDGSTLKTDSVEYGGTPVYTGSTPTKPADAQYTYAFKGWDKALSAVTGNVTYTAQFTNTTNKYTVTWKNDDGSTLKTDSVEYGKTPTYTGSTPTKKDMNFRGFTYHGSLAFDEDGTALQTLTVTENMEFTAQFAGNAKLTIVSNMPEAGTFGGEKECNFDSYCDIFAHPKQGYNFVGWYQINNETQDYDFLVATEQDYKFRMWRKDVTIQAKFEIASFDLTLISNNPDLGQVFDTASQVKLPKDESTLSHKYLSMVTVSAITKTDTYRFLGWYDENNQLVSPNAVYTFPMVNCDYTLEAKWNRFDITYELDGGTNDESNPATYAVEDVITLADPTKVGYSFSGWTLGGETVSRIEGSTAKHIMLTAVWTPVDYPITYELNGGTNASGNPATYTVENEMVTLANPTRAGYTFAGWKEGNTITKGSTGNKTFTANWEIVTYTVTYNLNGGTNATANPATYTVESAIALVNPTRLGYTFKGWTEGNTIAKGSTGDKTFTANWETTPYTITYVLNGGTNATANPATYTLENAVTLADPTRLGYTFKGWTEGNTIAKGSIGNKTFTANWKVVTYSITYELNGGTNAANPATYTVEDEITFAIPTRTDFTFICWCSDIALTQEVIRIEKGSTGGKTIYAKWNIEEKYNVALSLYNAGKYNEAIAAFEALDGYKDSTETIAEIKAKPDYKEYLLKNATVGSTILFGAYEQDNNTSNGKEEIEWQVLAKEGTKILVVSKYALDRQQYNSSCTDVTWESCSLRTWLNGTFYNTAFDTTEKAKIVKTTVSADKNPSYRTNPGNATSDNVFLLSITEVNKYFSSDEARKCVPTAYAKAQGANTSSSSTVGGKATCWWWLRSPGNLQDGAAIVFSDGLVNDFGVGVHADDGAVRPALWIDPAS